MAPPAAPPAAGAGSTAAGAGAGAAAAGSTAAGSALRVVESEGREGERASQGWGVDDEGGGPVRMVRERRQVVASIIEIMLRACDACLKPCRASIHSQMLGRGSGGSRIVLSPSPTPPHVHPLPMKSEARHSAFSADPTSLNRIRAWRLMQHGTAWPDNALACQLCSMGGIHGHAQSQQASPSAIPPPSSLPATFCRFSTENVRENADDGARPDNGAASSPSTTGTPLGSALGPPEQAARLSHIASFLG
jgi:hypothetical protein